MLLLPPSVKIFISRYPVDMRKGFDGLCAIVRREWEKDIFTGHLFVFIGSQRNRIKILYWDTGGFVLYYKRLERGRFKSARLNSDSSAIEVASIELAMLLDGIDFTKIGQRNHWRPKKTLKGIDNLDIT